MEEYALLDESLFNLSNEDFTMKWGLLSWPWKITNMIQQVEETHVEEEERFRKLQMQDTATLNDRLDSLIVIFSLNIRVRVKTNFHSLSDF
jgi:dynein heavy chain, axonemal